MSEQADISNAVRQYLYFTFIRFEKRLFVIVRDVNDFAKRIGCIIEYKYAAFGSVDVAGNVELNPTIPKASV